MAPLVRGHREHEGARDRADGIVDMLYCPTHGRDTGYLERLLAANGGLKFNRLACKMYVQQIPILSTRNWPYKRDDELTSGIFY